MKKILIFIFLTSCTTSNFNTNYDKSSFDFDKDTSFNDFKKKLDIYGLKNPYPDIDSN